MRTFLRVCIGMVLAGCTLLLGIVVASLLLIVLAFGQTHGLTADCGLVFGAAVSGRDIAGPAIVRRVAGAADLWRDGAISTLVLSGGKSETWRVSEAAVMREQALHMGVAPDAILLEETSRSTKQNLQHAEPILREHCTTVVAISDQYHIARIRLLAKQLGWGSIATYGVPDRPGRGELRSVLREWIAYVYYALGADAFFRFDEYDDHVLSVGTVGMP